MNVLITNIGRRIYFVDFLMDLKKNFKDLNIHLANHDPFSSVLSYKKTKIHKIPLIAHGSKKYINAIKNIVLKNKINLIIPTTKYDLKILSLNKEKLKLYNCEVLVSSYNLIKKLLNKESSYFLCKKKNIKTPKIYLNFKEIGFKKSRRFIKKKKIWKCICWY